MVEESKVVEALVAWKRPFTDEEALAMKPPTNSMIVEVACSPPACLVNGQEKEEEPHPVQLVTVRLPMLATLARRSVVEARVET